MSRFFDLVSKPVQEMGDLSTLTPAPLAPITKSGLIPLDSNENPFGPSPRAIQAMQAALATSNAYPDDDCTGLKRRLAEHHSVPLEQVMVTAGSTGLIALLCQTLLAPGLNAITSERSFIVYSMAVHATGAQLVETPMRDHGIDLDAILAAINEHTRIVFIANPNNPTGTLLAADTIDKFIAEVPGHVVVVLDEAYYEFAMYFAERRNVEYSRSLDYLRQGATLVVLRTFSKAHGLAGLRIGYGLGPIELLAYCARMRNTFSVSSIAQAAALAAIEDKRHIHRAVSNNAAQAQALGEALSDMGLNVIPTSANFFCCDVNGDAASFADTLRAEGIAVRPLGAWGAPSYIRVTIGLPEQNEAFLTAMRKVAGPRET
jgi:histidinol-phosphate aminotransferase